MKELARNIFVVINVSISAIHSNGLIILKTKKKITALFGDLLGQLNWNVLPNKQHKVIICMSKVAV